MNEFHLNNKMDGKPYIPKTQEEYDDMVECFLPKSDVPEKYWKFDKVLYLPLKKKWFNMIKSGEKKEEYREITPYWRKRLTDLDSHIYEINTLITTGKPIPIKPYTHVHFTLGYPKKDDYDRHMIFELKSIRVRNGNEEWGAIPNKNYFVIELGERVS